MYTNKANEIVKIITNQQNNQIRTNIRKSKENRLETTSVAANSISDEERTESQHLIRKLVVILSDISDTEQRLANLKKEAMQFYTKLDNISDG